MSAEVVRARVRIYGLVQGVGFRPFVWREATRLGLSGWVSNDPAGVVVEVEGYADAVTSLLAALQTPPPLARVDQVQQRFVATTGELGFEVRISDVIGARVAQVSPDTATCGDCLRELRDPSDRRFGYPFLNCTNCGPRFTIVLSVPYDRSRTTMASFPMCRACATEYQDPRNRRFHAEPVCCPACGPALEIIGAAGDPLSAAVEVLRAGGIVAVKGLGGFHLAVDALQESAVSALRRRKHREHRPFAVMVRDVAAARVLAVLGPAEQALLESTARPIVLLSRSPSAVAESVAPGATTLGLMLPYTPLHHLLLESFDGPLVMTSGNLSDEPIAFQDDDAAQRLAGVADVSLVHDRAIRTRVDDSVVKVVAGRVVPIRRSRGYVPNPVLLPISSPVPVLACGAALKSTFALVRGDQAFVSHHIGDLGDYLTQQSYLDGITHLSELLDVEVSVLAHDLHPDYPSTRYARGRADGAQLLGVQHHHAHIASCLADNGSSQRVIGVAFDGLGLGTDGTAWGGEFLVADLEGFTREAHLAPVAMPGGDAASQQPWRMAAAHLDAAYAGSFPELDVQRRQGALWGQVLSVARAGLNSPLTSSAGRLFDAVSAILGLRDVLSYEGQAAIELEQVADASERGTYPVSVDGAVVDVAGLIRAVVDDLGAGAAVPVIAARFHNALADVIATVCGRLREEHELSTVALSGGVFQNSLLLARALDRLEGGGFEVLTHRQVPCNDGGISLGQAAVAAARLSAGG